MKPRLGLPADLIMHLVWLPLLIVGIGLLASGALSVFNWLVSSR